jgi:broad specificity phosphatase PhoE
MTTSSDQKKTVHFIRHAESVCNVLRRELKVHKLPNSPVIPDPGLTYEGIQQTSRLKQYLGQTLKPEIAICSPYTRTLHTCLLSYGSKNVVVSPLCGERVSSCDDIGLPASYLEQLFPMLDFSSLDEVWWYMQDGVNNQCEAVKLISQGKLKFETDEHVIKRMEKFYDFLSERPEKNIAVFAHNDFLREFLSKYFEFSDSHLDNCEVFSTNI